jgi:hypothetical protein
LQQLHGFFHRSSRKCRGNDGEYVSLRQALARPVMSSLMLSRPLRLLTALALGVAITGCGKSLPEESRGAGNSTVIAPVSPQGAGGLTTKNTTRLGGADAITDAAAVALAVNPGLAPASRPGAVVLVNEHNWPAALAASALASAPLRAPLLYTDGNSLPQVSAQALATMRPTGTPVLGGAQIIQIGTSAGPTGYRRRTLPSTNPSAQAAAIERLASTAHHGAIHQVIVTAVDGPPSLAMPAAGLAAQTGAPILFVTAAGIPAATSAVLSHLHRPSIYAVGPASALSNVVLDKLQRLGPTKRIVSPVGHIVGSDPVGNSIAVALFTDGAFGWGVDEPGHGLAFASISRPLDAPAAAPLSASGEYSPLLLLEGPDTIPHVLSEYLTDIRPGYNDTPAYRPVHGVYNHGWLIGDESVISATTQAELDAMLEISPRSSTSLTSTSATTTSTGQTEASTTSSTTSASTTSVTSANPAKGTP